MALGSFSIQNIPARQRLMLLILLFAAAGYFGYYWFIQDLRTEVSSLDSSIQALEAEVQQAQLIEARLAEFRREVREQRQQLAEFRTKLPSEKETAELMSKIQELAVQNDLKIKTFMPQPTERRDFYLDWPIEMTLEGNFHNLAAFFQHVGQLGRLVNIGNVSLRSMEDTTVRSRTIGASCTATTFVYVEETDA